MKTLRNSPAAPARVLARAALHRRRDANTSPETTEPSRAARNLRLWRAWRDAADSAGPRSPAARDAMTALVEANQGLVWRIALGYANAREFRADDALVADCASEGMLGFMHGVEKYDPANEAGASLAHYASQWVRQHIQRWLMVDRTIHVPLYLMDRRAIRREVAADREAVRRALRVVELGRSTGSRETAMDDMVGDDTGLMGDRDRLSVPEMVELAEQHERDRAEVASLLGCLTDREREVVALVYGLGGHEPLTRREIGDRLGKSREYARKVIANAFLKMRVRAGVVGGPSR